MGFGDSILSTKLFRFGLSVAVALIILGGMSVIALWVISVMNDAAMSADRSRLEQLEVALRIQESQLKDGCAGHDENATVPVSWRVQLLSYVGRADLDRAYDRREAWDSAINRELALRCPSVFLSPNQEESAHTSIISIRPDNAFPPNLCSSRRFPVGTLIICCDSELFQIPWTDPSDLTYLQLSRYLRDDAQTRGEGIMKKMVPTLNPNNGRVVMMSLSSIAQFATGPLGKNGQ